MVHYRCLDLLSFQLAIEYGTKFMETSAKANLNVEDAFFTLARDIKVIDSQLNYS